MFVHNLDPVFIDLGIISIRWYSLAYIAGIFLGWWVGKKIILTLKIQHNIYISPSKFDDLITYLVFSIILGGRIGYIFFYNLSYYIENPFEIAKIWQGGMSFHGGLIGVILGTYFFCKKNKIQIFPILDVIACVAPIGLFFGRIANFINGELYGKITSAYWGVIFPEIDQFIRHPSQIYEAILEGLALFIILNKIIKKKNYTVGTCSFIFLILYGSFRIFSEMFREPDQQLGYLFNVLSMGTLLSILMIVIGITIFYFRKNERKY